ncbi:MAG TPA: hypothetical protein PKD64_00050 [Pirellulaceae bacterium]|nr:hypothetical protein [Pirellulaceae bacterium]HMO90562.1 hypothetical protein [Pirellulaceae bacterium]HMP71219.1 hypothetical protein [Pirellulaceae bacterium]
MSDFQNPNPYQTPNPNFGGSSPMGADQAAARVAIPAIIIIIYSLFSIVYAASTPFVGPIIQDALNDVIRGILPSEDARREFDAQMEQQRNNPFALAVNISTAVISIVFFAFIIFGAWQMKTLGNWGWALAASIMSIIPCGCCCLIGTPVGIWALVIIVKPEIKQAFRSMMPDK